MYTGAEERQFSNTENGHKRGKVMIVIAMQGNRQSQKTVSEIKKKKNH
jgi:hypothetical protein